MSGTNIPRNIDTLASALHRAGWSMGEVGAGSVWVVSGTHGSHEVNVCGPTQLIAWQLAYVQAAEIFDPFAGANT